MPLPRVQEPIPELPGLKLVDAEIIERAFSFEDGFHRVDWDAVHRWIETNVDPLDVDEAWNEAALLWVTKVRGDLGGGYFVLQSQQTILLSDRSVEIARWLLKYAGRVVSTINKQLGRTAWSGSASKNVILVFGEEDDYYQYVAFHAPEGEQPASGGMCIHSGYTHIAIPWRDELDAANAVVHELTHDCLGHLPLPLWLNEGVAMTLQKQIAPTTPALGQGDQSVVSAALIDWRPPLMWDELAERHFTFWDEENIQSFWAGVSFHVPGDPNELSYSLAEVLVKLLCENVRVEVFQAFLEAARQDDAGQTAAIEVLGVDLGVTAGTFLGAGSWRPVRKALAACWKDAGWTANNDRGNQTNGKRHDGPA